MCMEGRRLDSEQIELLKQTRNQRRKVASLESRWDASPIRGGYQSPQISAMPKGNSVPSGLDGSKQANESEFQTLIDERDALYTLLEQAREIVNLLDYRLSIFAFHYYLEGLEMNEVAETIGRNVATCWRYAKRVENRDLVERREGDE